MTQVPYQKLSTISFNNPAYDPNSPFNKTPPPRPTTQPNSIAKAQQDVNEVRDIMKKSLEDAINMTPKLNDLDNATANLAVESKKFNVAAKKLKWSMLSKKIKMIIILIIIVLILILIIALAVGIHR